MPKPLIWSPQATKDLEGILDHLAQTWEPTVTLTFLHLIEHLLSQIAHHPRMYPKINKKLSIHKCVITKHNTLFYRTTKSHIEVVRLYDTRQDPLTLTF